MTSTDQSQVDYLKSLPSIRTRCNKLFDLAKLNELNYWKLDLTQESTIVDFVFSLITRDYGNNYNSIPPHGRWRHFIGNRIDPLLNLWKLNNVEPIEIARRLIDLMTVSVLLDAGAGNLWKFKSKEGEVINRSEGLAVASLEMFESGLFSSFKDQPYRVDSIGLANITILEISNALQVTSENPMDGIDGRAQLLLQLSTVLTSSNSSKYFYQTSLANPEGTCRPGHLIDYLLTHSTSIQIPSPSSYKIAVKIETMWDIVVNAYGLSGVWPESRTKLDGVSLGDVWPAEVLKGEVGEGGNLVPFHKLSQWLTYSLIEVMETILGWKFIGKELMTGLPEYRNGGLLIDLNLLVPIYPSLFASFSLPPTPLPSLLDLPPFHASHPAIVEMRAITVIMLDRIAEGLNQKIKTNGGSDKLQLVQVLEGGTWKAGREIAKKLRPTAGGPPFNIISDGTIF